MRTVDMIIGDCLVTVDDDRTWIEVKMFEAFAKVLIMLR